MSLSLNDKMIQVTSSKNALASIKILKGHFATRNSHLDTYIDMSNLNRYQNAREAARVLADQLTNVYVDTIVCLDGTENIGSFLALLMAESTMYNMNRGNNIAIITPEFNNSGQILFRDNTIDTIKGQHVLVLAATVTTAKTVWQAMESIEYYGGKCVSIASLFSAVTALAGKPIISVFSSKDIPDYKSYEPGFCPLCKEGKKLDALVNSYGYSSLK